MRRTVRRRHNIGRIEHNILEDLTLGDILYAHLLSARSTKRFYQLAHERATQRYRRRRAIERLEAGGYIKRKGQRYQITEAGLLSLGAAADGTAALLKTAKWDGKWRVAAFDIPEEAAGLRDRVRNILKRAGFVQLQRSVWVYPHECGELVRLIKDESRLSSHLLYGVLERVEGEAGLKKIFRLE